MVYPPQLPLQDSAATRSDPTTPPQSRSLFLALPAELITHVVSFLPLLALPKVAASCKAFHAIVHQDAHWKARVHAMGIPHPPKSHAPFASWKDLVLGHYPYWFLPKHKIWFADGTDTDSGLAGQLVLVRYDHRTGNIEGYQMTAEKGVQTLHPWEEKNEVTINDFNPRVQLHLSNPVLTLRPRIQHIDPSIPPPQSKSSAYDHLLTYETRVDSDFAHSHGIQTHILLAKAIETERIHPSMSLWPPRRLPAMDRVRRLDQPHWIGLRIHDAATYTQTSEKPATHEQICDSAFRIRRQIRAWGAGARALRGMFELIPGGLRRAESVSTFATLPPEAYTPTKQKPYVGLFVGDYSGNGCEFLLVQQRIGKEIRGAEKIEPRMDDNFLHPTTNFGVPSPVTSLSDVAVGGDQAVMGVEDEAAAQDPEGFTGRLEAVKLTGDAHIPRGEFTWIAEDIGNKGYLYTARSGEFKDARVVRSWGHIAGRGFRDDAFMKAELILVSHNCLAQFWVEFGHVSYYKRVDMDRFLNVDDGEVAITLDENS